jgi:Carboxypeptidase regulatory-like domain
MPRKQTLSFKTVCLVFFLWLPHAYGAEIVGRITDRDTKVGIAGALVRAIPQQKNQREVLDKTGGDGKYHLELLRGKYKVFVSVPDSNYMSRFYGETEREEPEVIDVPTFQSFIIVDISLEAGGSISGTVSRRVDGLPVNGLKVYAESSNSSVSTSTNPDGRYVLRALPPDRYRVHIVLLDENYVSVYFDDAFDLAQSVSLSLERQQRIAGIDFRLRYGGIISGRVYARKNREPISGLRVIAERRKASERPIYTYTDAEGFYTLRGLPDGFYTVEAGSLKESTGSLKPRRRYLTQYYRDRFDRELSESLRIGSGSHITGIDFSLVAGGKISGTVRSRYSNTPVFGVEVILQEATTTLLNPPRVSTDRQGHYLIEDVPPGEYVVDTALPKQDQRLVRAFYRDKLSFEHADRVMLEEDGWARDIDFNLALGGGVKGRLKIDQPDYQFNSAADAVVMKRISPDLDGFGERSFKIKSDGSFEIAGVPPGRYRLTPKIADPNILPAQSSTESILDLAEGDAIEGVDFTFAMGGSISGKVSTTSPTYPLEKLNLILISVKENTKTFFDLASEDFTIGGVEPGKYVLVLLSNPEKTHPNQTFQPTRVFDTRLVEIAKGKMTRNVDFQINESAEKQSGLLP